MKHTHEPVMVLSDETVERVVSLIRSDEMLGDETSSWSSVCPTEWEASERLRKLVEEGIVAVPSVRPVDIVTALRAFEPSFLS